MLVNFLSDIMGNNEMATWIDLIGTKNPTSFCKNVLENMNKQFGENKHKTILFNLLLTNWTVYKSEK